MGDAAPDDIFAPLLVGGKVIVAFSAIYTLSLVGLRFLADVIKSQTVFLAVLAAIITVVCTCFLLYIGRLHCLKKVSNAPDSDVNNSTDEALSVASKAKKSKRPKT